MFYFFMLGAHLLLTTTGYAGLIAATVYLLFVCKARDPRSAQTGLDAWRRSARIFGPLLGLGIFLGFRLAMMLHVPLTSPWLVATYFLLVVAMAVQAGLMIPWQIRSSRALAVDALPSLGPVRSLIATLSVAYTAIIGLMIVRPG